MTLAKAYSRSIDRSMEQEPLVGNEDDVSLDLDLSEPPSLSFENALKVAGFGRFHYYLVAVLGWASSADAVEMLTVSFLLPPAECEFSPTDLEKGFLTAVGFAGMLVGAYVWGSLADVYGRRKILLMCQGMNALFAVGTALSQSFSFLIVMRLFSGFGVGGTAPIIFVYFVEFLPANKRGSMLGLLSTMWIVGQILTAGMAWWIIPMEWEYQHGGFLFNSWKLFTLVAALPVVSSVLLFIPIPESPKFLLQTFNLQAIEDDEVHVRNKPGTIVIIINKTMGLFTNKAVRWNFILSSSILMCLSFGYYGLNMWFPELLIRLQHTHGHSICSPVNTSTNESSCIDHRVRETDTSVYFDSFLMAVSSIPGCVLYILCVERIGRKVITSATMVVSGAVVFGIYAVVNRSGIIALMCVFTGITNVTWNSIGLITVEIFPTKIRSTAKGMQSLMQRIAAIIANVGLGALMKHHCSIPILSIAVLMCVGGLLTIKLPNFSNKDIK